MRRHLTGLGLAVAMFLVMFFGGAWGYLRLLRPPAAAGAPLTALPAQGGSLLSSTGVLTSMGVVAVTGVLAGILIAWPRISPLAAGLPGLLALAWTVLYMVSVKQAVALIPLRGHAFGAGWEALLFNGILGFAGLALVIPMFLPARWRDPYVEEDAAVEADVSDAREFVADLKSDSAGVGSASAGPAGAGSASAGSAGAGSPGRPAAGLVSAAPWERASAATPGRAAQASAQPGQASPQSRTTGARPGVITGRTIPPGQRMTGSQPRVTGSQQRVTGSQQRLTGFQPGPGGAQPGTTGAQPGTTGAQPRVTGSQQRMTGGQPTLGDAGLNAQLRLSGAQQRLISGQAPVSGRHASPANRQRPGASENDGQQRP